MRDSRTVSAVGDASALVVFPVAAAVLGAVVAGLRQPGPTLTSGVQHFAAGVVFAAVAGEVLPSLRDQHSTSYLIIGFVVGVALMLGLRVVSKRVERANAALPVGLIAIIGVDLGVDGLLVGVGAALGEGQGRILTIALTIEVLFLGLSLVIGLRERGAPRSRAIAVTCGTSLAIAVGAIGGAAVLGGASHNVLAAVLAFGAAALLFLVVEELLVEAHEKVETAVLTALFFVGFLAIFLLEG